VVQHQPSELQKLPPGGAPPEPVEVVVLVVEFVVLLVALVVLAVAEVVAPPAPPVDATLEVVAPPEPEVLADVELGLALLPHAAAAQMPARRRLVWTRRITDPRATR
jgi:hypothetical protein